jgi:DNA anti-recombination protein RmuC
LENDTLVIGKDDVRKILDDVATALQDKMKAGLDDQYDKIKQDMIRRKQEDLLSLESQTAEGITQIQEKTDAVVKRLNDEGDKKVDKIQKEGDEKRKDLAELGETLKNELKTATKAEREEQYIDSKQSK